MDTCFKFRRNKPDVMNLRVFKHVVLAESCVVEASDLAFFTLLLSVGVLELLQENNIHRFFSSIVLILKS